MKKLHFAAAALFCLMLFAGFTANAQKEGKSFSFGFGLEAGLPLGNATNAYQFTGGLDIRLSYRVGPGFVTLSTGAVGYVPKSNLGRSTKASLQIPIKAGYKYVFHKPFFAMGEIGYSSFRIYYGGTGNEVAHITSGGFTYATSAGVSFDPFEAGIKYEGTSLSGGTLSNLSIRLGFNF